jgi:hypothetical protein
MSRRSTPKTSYQKLHADSGYLSGLVDKARRSDEAAAKRLFSSSSGRSRLDVPISLLVRKAHCETGNSS